MHSLESSWNGSVKSLIAHMLVKSQGWCCNYTIATVMLRYCFDDHVLGAITNTWWVLQYGNILVFNHRFLPALFFPILCYKQKQKQISLELGRQKLWEWSFRLCECGWLLGCFPAFWGLLFRVPIFLQSFLDYESYYNYIIVYQCVSWCGQAVVNTYSHNWPRSEPLNVYFPCIHHLFAPGIRRETTMDRSVDLGISFTVGSEVLFILVCMHACVCVCYVRATLVRCWRRKRRQLFFICLTDGV